LVLKLLGYDRACNYDASWKDWGNRDDTPIEAGG
jgi:3-mercaptopyruvate sulfurtransferase SseA